MLRLLRDYGKRYHTDSIDLRIDLSHGGEVVTTTGIAKADMIYLWQCAPSTELKGYAKHYDDGSCYLWQVRSSQVRITQKKRIQGKCKSCGRRPRLALHLVETFFDEEQAQEEADRRNKILQGYPQFDEVEDYHLSREYHYEGTEIIGDDEE